MKKFFKLLLSLCTAFAFISLSVRIGALTASADEITVANKGYETNNMTYLGDRGGNNIVMATDKYNYGYYSSWNACYKYVVNESIQKWLGHSQITTTEHLYAHFEYKSHIRSASKIAGALLGS